MLYLCYCCCYILLLLILVTDQIDSNDEERPRAYVVLKPGHSLTGDEVVHFMDGKVAAVKRITGGVVFLEAIPKNPSGKILRKTLREQAQAELKQGATAKL